ncbi:hypothetical protein SLEP1_g8860 [Rubroshorea leprosula]|uniref:Exostosin GT47 domain-containing protein n=1 Tax=Rubroshorea leprosula TaxID=152421 RepID=A0AAV5I344_9ROSI|nr:hypothetical protein SLEP1_g8860 [Rubroshorea leprosula]
MLFAGGGGVGATPNIRRSIRIECENNNSSIHTLENVGEYSKICEMVDCSNGICEHEPLRYMRPMLQATFCLQPPGDTPTRRSTFDSIIAGCMPVFFEELSAKIQYGWHMLKEQYGEFSVFIPREEVMSKRLRLLNVLMGMLRREVMKKGERVVELIPRVMYRRHGNSMGLRSIEDAFDIAVEGTLQRIKARIHNFSAR